MSVSAGPVERRQECVATCGTTCYWQTSVDEAVDAGYESVAPCSKQPGNPLAASVLTQNDAVYSNRATPLAATTTRTPSTTGKDLISRCRAPTRNSRSWIPLTRTRVAILARIGWSSTRTVNTLVPSPTPAQVATTSSHVHRHWRLYRIYQYIRTTKFPTTNLSRRSPCEVYLLCALVSRYKKEIPRSFENKPRALWSIHVVI